MSEAGSRSKRRISSPSGVPPGSRTATTFRPAAPSHSASIRICVVLPAPSGPSRTMRGMMGADSSQHYDWTRRALVDSVLNPFVRAHHELVEILLRRDEPLIRGLHLDLAEQFI